MFEVFISSTVIFFTLRLISSLAVHAYLSVTSKEDLTVFNDSYRVSLIVIKLRIKIGHISQTDTVPQ